jgi:hypothetical protein
MSSKPPLPKEPPKPFLEKAKTNLAALSSFLFILGYIDIYSYFKFIGMNIYPYLEASEIIFAFAELLMISVLVFGFFALFIFKIVNDEVTYDRGWALAVITVLSAIGAICLTVFTQQWLDEIVVKAFYFLSILALATTADFVLSLKPWKDHKVFLAVKMAVFFGIATLGIVAMNYFRADKVNNKTTLYGVEIERDEPLDGFGTSTNFIFVGQTKNFLFFKNIADKKFEIIPRSEVIYMKQTYVD